jgi:hypothetical protein
MLLSVRNEILLDQNYNTNTKKLQLFIVGCKHLYCCDECSPSVPIGDFEEVLIGTPNNANGFKPPWFGHFLRY